MIYWQHHTPVAYEDLPPEIKRELTNGCGGKGGFVKPPHKAFYQASCNHHDYGYSCGGTKEDRLKADKMLYRLMVEDCKSLSWYIWLRYRPWCGLYYWGVRMVGNKFFHQGPKRWPVV